MTSDGFHMVAPDPNGEQAGHAMTRASQLAGLQPTDIDHINAHATGTRVGDVAEGKAINNAVGSHRPAVYAPKSALGHSVGAVGAVESILTVLALLQNGIVPPPEPAQPGSRLISMLLRRALNGQLPVCDQQFVRLRRTQMLPSRSGSTDGYSMTIMAPGQSAKRWIRVTRCIDLECSSIPAAFRSFMRRDRSGVLAAAGTVNGVRTIAFCTDGTVMGGAMGVDGCQHRQRLRHRHRRAGPDRRAVAFRWRTFGRGRKGFARRGFGVRGHDPGIGLRPADLRGRRFRRPVGPPVPLTDVIVMAPGAGVRHRTRRGAQRHRRRRRHGIANWADTHHKRSRVCATSSPTMGGRRLRAWPSPGRIVLPSRAFRPLEGRAGGSDLHALLPESARRAYDVHPLVEALLDSGEDGSSSFEEIQAKWAPSIVVGLGRLSGRTVGVLANNPLQLGGCLNSESAEKAARLVQLCDAFGIPLVVIVDVPGYLPGVDQVGRRGAPRHKTVARLRRNHRSPRHSGDAQDLGGAYIAMNSRSLRRHKRFSRGGRRGGGHGREGGRRHPAQAEAGRGTGVRTRRCEGLAAEHERIAAAWTPPSRSAWSTRRSTRHLGLA